MADPTSTYIDPGGNSYLFDSNLGFDQTIIPNGFHFKNVLATAQFAADVLWLACFTAITVGICVVRHRDKGKAAGTSASYKYLRWPVIGLSVLSMLIIYALQTYNRIQHELRKPIIWFYPAVIGVITNVLNGFAQGLLIAFLLWQLTPILLLYGGASPRRTKYTIQACRFLVGLTSLLLTADTLVSAILWVLNLQKAYHDFQHRNTTATEAKIASISNINDAALSASATGFYLACILIFAAVARQAVMHLDTTPPPRQLKASLIILTLAVIARSGLDFGWALAFKVVALRPTTAKLSTNVLVTNLIHTVLYGFFSSVAYAAVLGVAAAPLPAGIDHSAVGVEHLPKEQRKWHQQVRRSLRVAPARQAAPPPPLIVPMEYKGGLVGVRAEELPLTGGGGEKAYADDGSSGGHGVPGYWNQGGVGYNRGWGGNGYQNLNVANQHGGVEEIGPRYYRNGVEYQPPTMQGGHF